MRYPTPLGPGDTVAVTSPSAGVAAALRPRLEFACEVIRQRGYQVRVGQERWRLRAAEVTAAVMVEA